MEINTNWDRTRDILDINKAGENITAPISLNASPSQYYTAEAVAREEALQTLAFGEGAVTSDFNSARSRAADELYLDREGSYIWAAEVLNSVGTNPQEIANLLNRPAFVSPGEMEGYALEQLAADKQRETTLEENGEVKDIAYANPEEAIADTIAKSNVLQTFAAKASEFASEAPLSDKLFYLGFRFIPGLERLQLSNTDPIDTAWNWLRATTRREQQEKLWEVARQSSTEEFYAYCKALDQTLKMKTQDPYAVEDFWKSMAGTPSVMPDIAFATEAGIIGMTLKNLLFGAGKTISPGMKSASVGNKKQWQERVLGLLGKAEKKTEESEELIKLATNSAVQPEDIRVVEATANSVEKEIANKIYEQQAIKNYDSLIGSKTASLTQEQQNKTLQAFVDNMKNNEVYGKEAKKIMEYVHIDAQPNKDGTLRAMVDIGVGTDGTSHFASQAAAEKFVANNTNWLKGEYEIAQDATGYKIRVIKDIPTTGLKVENWEDAGKPFKSGWLGRKIFAVKHVPDWAREADLLNIRAMEAKRTSLIKDFTKNFESLSAKEQTGLATVIEKGKNAEVWYDDTFLDSLEFTNNMKNAYHDVRSVADFDYVWRNVGISAQARKHGLRVINTKDASYVGKSVKDITNPSGYVYKNVDDGTVYHIGEMTDEMLGKLKEDGKVFVKLNSPVVENDSPVQILIGSRDSFESTLFPDFSMPYLAGGPRYYNERVAFLKQAHTMLDGGKTLVLKPKTIAGDMDVKVLREQAKEINGALKLYRDYRNGNISEDAIGGALNEATSSNKWFRVGSKEEMEGFIRSNKNPNGYFDWRYDVEVVNSDQRLATERRLLAQGAVDTTTEDALADNWLDVTRTNNQGYFARGDKPLKTWTGEDVPILDPLETMEREINKIVYMDEMRSYNELYANKFRELFGAVIDPNDLRRMSNEDILNYGRIMDTRAAKGDVATIEQINAAKTMQAHWRSISQVPSEWDKTRQAYMMNLADNLGDLPWFGKLFKRGSKPYELIAGLDPVKFARAMTYHIYMGMLNPKHLWMQALGASNVVLIDPVNGSRAVSMYPALRSAMATDDVSKLRHLAKVAKGLSGMKEDHFLSMIKDFKRLGLQDNQAVLSTYQSAGILKKLARQSTFFAREGENFNALVAHAAAYQNFITKNGGKLPTLEELPRLMLKADDYYLNMTRASQSAMQTGVMSVPFQFSNYTTRWLEAVLGNKLTPMQRLRLLTGNLAMWGVDGVVGMGGYNVYKWLTENYDVDPEIARNVWHGVIDEMSKDFNLSAGPEVLGQGIFGKAFDAFSEGDLKIYDAIPAKGAVEFLADLPEIIKDTGGALYSIFHPNATEQDLERYLTGLVKSGTPSGLKNGAKALLAFKTGIWYNSNLDPVKRNVLPWQAIMYGLGFQPDEQQKLSDIYAILSDEDQVVKDSVDTVVEKWKQFYIARDDKSWQDYEDTFALLTLNNDNSLNISSRIRKEARERIKKVGITTQMEKVIKNNLKKNNLEFNRKLLEATDQW